MRKLLELYQNNQIDDAENLARKITVEDPSFALGWKVLGSVYGRKGQVKKSKDAFNRLINLNPQDPEAHNLLALVLQASEDFLHAEESFKHSLLLNNDYTQARVNLGTMYYKLSRYSEAENCFRWVLHQDPKNIDAKINLGATLLGLGKRNLAEQQFSEVLSLQPDNVLALNNLANVLSDAGRYEDAEASYKNFLKTYSRHEVVHYNLANVLKKQGKLEEAEKSYLESLSLAPGFSDAHNNLGMTQLLLGRQKDAGQSFLAAFRANPRNSDSLYNYAGTCDSVDESISRLNDCLSADADHTLAKLTRAALLMHLGQDAEWLSLEQSPLSNHSYMRSFRWVCNLPRKPIIYTNRWQFFDEISKNTDVSRPFYEFGVWRAHSFRYLIKIFKKGYGFDTFSGLPEDWKIGGRTEGIGSYSSSGDIPQIEGAEFIVGKFEDTLPEFFTKTRQLASLVNFDADLYSSTLCALSNCKKIIDESTILIFDEFLLNESWEEDEYRALEDFCALNDCSYTVVAVSFFTKQVAIKLIDI